MRKGVKCRKRQYNGIENTDIALNKIDKKCKI